MIRQIVDRALRVGARIQESRRRDAFAQQVISSSPSGEDRLRRAVAHRLHWSALTLCGASVTAAPAQVNLVLPELRSSALFAGIDTALRAAGFAANIRRSPLRVISIGNALSEKERQGLQRDIRRRSGLDAELPLELVGRESLQRLDTAPEDLWIPTHWTTAHAVASAIELTGSIRTTNVVYLVQDYEPGFTPWSTEYALARATYHAGFRHLVNSMPLATYLAEAESIQTDADVVFRPDVRVPGEAAERNAAARPLRIVFYGRPSKPRNLFNLGVAVLQRVAQESSDWGREIEFVSAGELHSPVELTPSRSLNVRGRLSWDAYFELLSQSDVLLSLQHSPHPSHPPLDAVVRGCYAVTNEFGGTRRTLSPLISATEPRIDQLADAVLAVLARVRDEGRPMPDREILGKLGVPLEEAVRAVVSKVGE